VYSLLRIRQIDINGEGDKEGYFILGDKDRLCTYDVMLRRFHATIVEVEKQ